MSGVELVKNGPQAYEKMSTMMPLAKLKGHHANELVSPSENVKQKPKTVEELTKGIFSSTPLEITGDEIASRIINKTKNDQFPFFLETIKACIRKGIIRKNELSPEEGAVYVIKDDNTKTIRVFVGIMRNDI